MSNEKDQIGQADQGESTSKAHIVLIVLCIIVLLSVLACGLHFNLYAF